MKTLFALLLSTCLLSSFSVSAATGHGSGKGLNDKEVMEPATASAPSRSRALQVTHFFTDVLRLSQTQAVAVQKATLRKLQQLEAASTQEEVQPLLADDDALLAQPTVANAVREYDAAMLRILTPGQYNAFRFLEERQPTADLLALQEAR